MFKKRVGFHRGTPRSHSLVLRGPAKLVPCGAWVQRRSFKDLVEEDFLDVHFVKSSRLRRNRKIPESPTLGVFFLCLKEETLVIQVLTCSILLISAW